MNTESIIRPLPTPNKRPKLVWLISIFYLLSAGWTLLSFVLIYSGRISLNGAQLAYFRSQTIFDIFFTISIGLLNITGALFLFLLKRYAYYAFLYAFVLSMLMTAYHVTFKNWIGAIGIPGLIGAFIGWTINIAIILYARDLTKKGISK